MWTAVGNEGHKTEVDKDCSGKWDNFWHPWKMKEVEAAVHSAVGKVWHGKSSGQNSCGMRKSDVWGIM